MYFKFTFCPIILLLWASLSFAQNVNVVIHGAASIAKTDDNIVCVTLDWWPAEKCDYNQCPWGKAGILNLDLRYGALINAIKAFNPLRIKGGGSLQDNVVYKVGEVSNCPHFMKREDGLFGFSQGCLSMERWDQLNRFFNHTGVKLTFGLNALFGRKESQTEKVHYFERIQSRFILIWKSTIWIWDGCKSPGGFYEEKWFNTFLEVSGQGIVDGLTHHIYNLGPGDDPNMMNKILDPSYLNQVSQTYKGVSDVVNKFRPQLGAWVSESGGALNGGSKDVSQTFADGFWYLDQMGMASTYDQKVFCRQALIGGNYGLLNATTFVPNPDYYGALLWHRLMGSTVLAVTKESDPNLRVYAHCAKKKPGVSLIFINLSKDRSFNITLSNAKPGDAGKPNYEFVGKQNIEEYHLRALTGDIKDDIVCLNDVPMVQTDSEDIPAMDPKLVDASTPISIAAQSIAYVTIRDFEAPACV
ncbi:glucuronidase 1 [Hibiscus trionum]|uniref:Glucuronidase 1 n=1 Tax=Hibiscus trionum TaxID=183268 RepID=A0A9W7MBQ3_HIBTR|nr:glucuronidase 1 [Hibiscus trionum]